MQNVAQSAYPSPPASPAYGAAGPYYQSIGLPPPVYKPVYIPPLPEQRRNTLVDGRLLLKEILGTGAYGVVYSAVDIQTGVEYAVKALNKFTEDGSPVDLRQQYSHYREIDLHLAASGHRNVVSIQSIINNPDCLYVIMDFCPESDLFYNITALGKYVGQDELARDVFLQVLDAVEHCHQKGIYHRDLKPENILVSDNGESVKLADFGLATCSVRSNQHGCGSTFYMSPECLAPSAQRPYYMCAPNDVWSLGVILVNLTCGRNPWKQASFDDSTYMSFTKDPDYLKSILAISDELNDILRRIFTRNPEQRITVPELRNMILACSHFTRRPEPVLAIIAKQQPVVVSATTPYSPPTTPPPAEVDMDMCAIIDDDDYEYSAPSSPAASDSSDDSILSDTPALDSDSDSSSIDDEDVDFRSFTPSQSSPQSDAPLQPPEHGIPPPPASDARIYGLDPYFTVDALPVKSIPQPVYNPPCQRNNNPWILASNNHQPYPAGGYCDQSPTYVAACHQTMVGGNGNICY